MGYGSTGFNGQSPTATPPASPAGNDAVSCAANATGGSVYKLHLKAQRLGKTRRSLYGFAGLRQPRRFRALWVEAELNSLGRCRLNQFDP